MRHVLPVLTVLVLLLLATCRPSSSEPVDPPRAEATPLDTAVWLAKGLEITNVAQKTLGGELMAALERGGVDEAVPYCHTRALAITDSLSSAHGIDVSRTALKMRNPANEPTDAERAVLQTWAASDEMPAPVVRRADGTVLYHRPILTMDLCLPCHGTVGQDVSEADHLLITSLYPQDRATGFRSGDLRGAWTVAFPAE